MILILIVSNKNLFQFYFLNLKIYACMKSRNVFPLKGYVFIVLWIFAFSAFAQVITVQGTVTDVDGDALIGVTVQVQGTTTGTVTDMNGEFTLSNVSPQATLEVSYVGMQTVIIPVMVGTGLTLK